MYALQFRNCKGEVGSVRVPDSQAYNQYATYADLILLGRDTGVSIPDAVPDSHIEQVGLIYTDDLSQKSVLVSSVFLLCEHDVAVTQEKATSQLYVPGGKT